MGGPPRRLKPEALTRLKEMAGGDAGLFGLVSRHAIPVGKRMVYVYVPLASDNRDANALDMVMRVFELLSAARMLAFAIRRRKQLGGPRFRRNQPLAVFAG